MRISTIVNNIIDKLNLHTRLFNVSKDFTGFVSRSTSTLSSTNDSVSITFDFDTTVYKRGKEYKFLAGTTRSLDVSAVRGGRYVGINVDTGSLELVTANPDFSSDLLCMYIYRNNTELVVFGDERHSASRDTDWHKAQHLNVGAVLRDGGLLGLTLNDDTNLNVEVSTPIVIADEDLEHTIVNGSGSAYSQVLGSVAEIPCVYVGSGSYYVQTVASAIPFPVGADRAQYNNAVSGTLVEAEEGEFICYYLVVTNDSKIPVKWIVGREAHATVDGAIAEGFDALGLPLPEIVPINKVVVQTSSTFVNKIKFVTNYKIYDRIGTVNSSYVPTDHDSLFGRDASNQHTIGAITGLQSILDTTSSSIEDINDVLDLVNIDRADRVLATKNVANMLYNLDGKLVKVRYTVDSDSDYEVLTYSVDNKLSNVAHYLGGVLKGNTVLTYSSGKLVSAVFTAV